MREAARAHECDVGRELCTFIDIVGHQDGSPAFGGILAQQLPQLFPRIGLDRLLPQNVLASCKGSEQLTVQIVSVRQKHDRRIVHLSYELA